MGPYARIKRKTRFSKEFALSNSKNDCYNKNNYKTFNEINNNENCNGNGKVELNGNGHLNHKTD